MTGVWIMKVRRHLAQLAKSPLGRSLRNLARTEESCSLGETVHGPTTCGDEVGTRLSRSSWLLASPTVLSQASSLCVPFSIRVAYSIAAVARRSLTTSSRVRRSLTCHNQYFPLTG